MVVVGMDSMKDDGIYTGFISSHQIYGAGGKYFSFSVSCSNLKCWVPATLFLNTKI